jgi:hypothetical protein
MSFPLPESLAAWQTPAFAATFCREVAQLGHGILPLQQVLAMGSHVVERPPQVMLLSSNSSPRHLEIRAGVFFSSVIAGCNCADDPTPQEENNEYGELLFRIDRHTGITEVEPG